ncbi:MAG: kinase-like domain-containing protein [Monoraphidium minutum]|nr:MAG: kinase-like domain-containing protein [Monoraphidium minutum]
MGCLNTKPAVEHVATVAEKPAEAAGAKEASGKGVPQVEVSESDGASAQLMVVLNELLLPDDEDVRWDALTSYNILDTEPEEAYERITKLCKTLFKVPIAMVTFVDKERVWLKSVQGLSGLTEVDRRYSICAWTLLSRYPEALVVPDLREDIRFKDYPVVTGWPYVKSYAAAPIVTAGGQRLGTLCILDYKVRAFTAENALLLAQLSGMVMREVERKRQMNDVLCNAALKTSGQAVATDRQGVMLVDASSPKWQIMLVNDAWQRATGISSNLAAGANFWDLFEAPPMAQLQARDVRAPPLHRPQACKLAVDQRRNFELRAPCARNPPPPRPPRSCTVSTSGTFSSTDGFDDGPLPGGVPSGPYAPTAAAAAAAAVARPPPSLASAAGGDAGPRSGALLGGGGAAAPGPPRWVCLQFRSAGSPTALGMGPTISIPPTLMTAPDKQNYYWVTVDESQTPGAGGAGGGDDGPGWSTGSPSSHAGGNGGGAGSSWAGGDGGGGYASSVGGGAGGGPPAFGGPSDTGSEPATPQRVTTFNLLPEENAFADITIGSLLGWGSYGRVHRGFWNGSLVAIKILEQVAGDFNPRTALEPLLHHRLSHPNIVRMFDISTQEVDVCEDGRPLQEVWMVLEYCNRGTLGDATTRGALCLPAAAAAAAARSSGGGGGARGVPDVAKVVRLARGVASAMAYLHSENVLHGDLNGNNILLVSPQPGEGDPSELVPKVADFGLSRLLPIDSDQIMTRTHGTITHMAPEVITESLHSKAADVYSFGVVMWELLTMSKPYSGLHYAQIVHAIAESKGLDVPAAAPPALQQLLRACLAPRPQARPSFQEVDAALASIEADACGAPPAAAADPAAAAPAGPPAAAPDGAGGDGGCASCVDEIMKQAAVDPPPPPPRAE